jgi:WD40 repeat protein
MTHISEQWRLVPQVGHYAPLVSAVWSPDSGRILTGSRDGTVRVWNTLNGAELMRLELHSKVLSVCWSPDGRYIAASSEKGPIEVWDICSGKKIMSFDGKRPVASLDWSPNGAYLLTGFFDSAFCRHRESEETCAIVWDMQTGGKAFRLHSEGLEDSYSWGIQTNVPRFLTGGWGDSCSAAWSPDGAHILTGHTAEGGPFRGSRVAVIWDGQSGRYLLRLEGHAAGITSVAWSPDGRRVLTGSRDGSARVWDSAEGKELLRIEGHTEGISCVDWSADGARILTACCDSRDWTTRVWDCENGQELIIAI